MILNIEDVNELKYLLNDLILKLQEVQEYDLQEQENIYNRYREVYALYKMLSQEELEVFFEPHEVKLIEYFQLGTHNETQFNELALTIQQGLESVYQFISTDKGFALLNGQQNFDVFTEDELKEVFGHLFGIELSKKCVKSLRAERIGSVLGYAISGCFENIRESLHGLSDDEKVSRIKRDIEQQDKCFIYGYQEKNDGVIVSADIKNDNPNRTRVRGRNRADHCFVNPKNKTLTIGSSTSNMDATGQGYSFYKSYIAASEMVKQPTINGANNPYFQYQVRPFIMMNSRFSVEGDSIDVGANFKEMLSKCSANELKNVSQLTWLRMMSNCINKEHLIALAEHQAFILGCDTSNIHAFTNKIRHTTDNKEQLSSIFSFTMKAALNAAKAMSKNDISLDFGRKVRVLQSLNDIHDSVQNILRRIGINLTPDLHQQYIAPLSKELTLLSEKIHATNTHNQSKQGILEQLNELSYQISDYQRCQSYIGRARVYPINNIVYERDPFSKKDVIKNDAVSLELQEEIENHIKKIFNHTNKKTLEEIMSSAPESISHDIVDISVNYFKNFMSPVVLDNFVKEIKQLLTKHDNKKSFYSFMSNRLHHMQRLGYIYDKDGGYSFQELTPAGKATALLFELRKLASKEIEADFVSQLHKKMVENYQYDKASNFFNPSEPSF